MTFQGAKRLTGQLSQPQSWAHWHLPDAAHWQEPDEVQLQAMVRSKEEELWNM